MKNKNQISFLDFTKNFFPKSINFKSLEYHKKIIEGLTYVPDRLHEADQCGETVLNGINLNHIIIDDLKGPEEGINVMSTFNGLGSIWVVLDALKIKVNKRYCSEIDHYTNIINDKNYPDTEHFGDVTKWREWNIDWSKIDLYVGGSPCQGFSGAGKQGGTIAIFKGKEIIITTREMYIMAKAQNAEFLSQSHLFWEFVLLLDHIKSCNPTIKFMLENVSMDKSNKDMISEALGVEPNDINSDLFVQQNRPRMYWSNIPIRELPQRPDWEGDFYQWRRTYYRKNKSGVCPCLTANMGTGGHNVPLHSKDKTDKLTINELEALQGLPTDYTAGVSNCRRLIMIGNGWTIQPIIHILSSMKD